MSYFVTGGSGFIGRRLIRKLLEREGTVYVLMLESELGRMDALREFWGPAGERVVPVVGNLAEPLLGVDEETRKNLEGRIGHFFHLAAIYDMNADLEIQLRVNVEGTRQAVRFAEAVDAGCFHQVSSIAAAGTYEGIFREDMFEQATGLEHPYFRTKHDSEGIVRRECQVPWRIYRPGMVVGDSRTGEIEKIDGPYYFFKLIQKLRKALPGWMPLIGIEGGRINLVPVDWLVAAMDHIAHAPGEDGLCFHLTDPHPRRIGEVLNLFARAAHAPEMSARFNARMFGIVPGYIWKTVASLPPVKRVIDSVLNDLGIPRSVMGYINYPTRFDSRETERLLKGTDIKLPDLGDYAWRLWDYWERNLDPDLFVDRSLRGAIGGKTVLVTGASSGIGQATACRLAEAGARVIMVARGEEALRETQADIEERGGEAHWYTCDLTNLEEIDGLIARVLADHGHVDILVNNAGRSIRRSVALSFDRFHDFERTMQLNYFGSLRMTMGLLPAMIERRRGHVINISSIGVLSNAPRFSAYVASKAALDAFARCAASELSHKGIAFTTINMPLVRTPMIAPTKIYENVPTISPEEAAELVAEAVIHKPKRVATRLGISAQILHLLFPKAMEISMNTAFQMFPDSTAAKGVKEDQSAASAEQIALAQFTKGIHW
ncbi:MAG TPA: SDR family oxidoreductase [Gammaproteobacteria bacterium]|nr:SDR family oxidoreductase [Gammaproteobacteria bacterium]